MSGDFDFEPVRGLPTHLPPGEALLWQGAPDAWCIARRVFHLPLVAGYLGMFPVWKAVTAIYDRVPLMEAARSIAIMVLLIAACCAILGLLAWAIARTTVYSITSERVVMRFGIALPMALNLPFAKIDNAAMKLHAGGCGDIPMTLVTGEKIPYLMLWPHARPWRMKRPEPMLRGVVKVEEVATILAQALAAAASRPTERWQRIEADAVEPQALPGNVVPVPASRPAPVATSGAADVLLGPQPIARRA
jgi:hypothetical protein